MTEDEKLYFSGEVNTICIILKMSFKRIMKHGVNEKHIKMIAQAGTRVALLARQLERFISKETR